MTDAGGRIVIGPPQNGEARDVPHAASLAASSRKGRGREELVFSTERGKQLRSYNFKARTYDTAVSAVGLPEDLWVHDLRYTAASLAVQSGASVKSVQRMLGHASAALTLDVYAGIVDQDLDNVAARMDALLAPHEILNPLKPP